VNDLKWHLSTSPVFLVHQEAGMHPLLTYVPHGQPKVSSLDYSGQTNIMSSRYQTGKCPAGAGAKPKTGSLDCGTSKASSKAKAFFPIAE
jgi:hypothetical protein